VRASVTTWNQPLPRIGTKAQLGNRHDLGLEAVAKKLAHDTDSGEIDARWFVAHQICGRCFHPVGLTPGVVCRLLRLTWLHRSTATDHSIRLSVR